VKGNGELVPTHNQVAMREAKSLLKEVAKARYAKDLNCSSFYPDNPVWVLFYEKLQLQNIFGSIWCIQLRD
jgi:hypothetical protein